jgi:hypothetical protein
LPDYTQFNEWNAKEVLGMQQYELTNSMAVTTLSDADLEGEITISPFYFAKVYSNYRIYISILSIAAQTNTAQVTPAL